MPVHLQHAKDVSSLMNDAELLQVVNVNSSVYVIGIVKSIEDSLAHAVLSC